MKPRYIIGGIIIIVFLVVAGVSLMTESVQYANLAEAKRMGKIVQVKGEWVQEKGSEYDPANNTFKFYMRDDNGETALVTLHGPKPNNFEIATSIVAKGRFKNDHFEATYVLTKCPSKYEETTPPAQSGT